jgi:hypothetical protein
MIPKPCKSLEGAISYRPISLLPKMNKMKEKAVLKRLHPILKRSRIFPGPSVWILTETLCHRTSKTDYRDNKRNLISQKLLIIYSTKAICSNPEEFFPVQLTEYYNQI